MNVFEPEFSGIGRDRAVNSAQPLPVSKHLTLESRLKK